jgi:calcineurin-like phosphoesterase family protein
MEALGRPFKDQSHQTEELVRLHNSVVAAEDLVIFNGDVIYQKTPELLSEVGRFNGKKILIRGNHDRPISDADFSKYFEAVYPDGSGMKMNCGGLYCYITHYPTGGLPDIFNLVSHVHSAWRYQLNMFNIGVDANHFLPINVSTIPNHFKAICEFYDEDVWVAYSNINEKYKGKRGKKGRYFTPQMAPQPNFYAIVEWLRTMPPEKIDEWRYVVNQEPNGSWTALIVGEGNQQCLASQGGFKSRQDASTAFSKLGVKRIVSGVG